jgi:hypothetical protein
VQKSRSAPSRLVAQEDKNHGFCHIWRGNDDPRKSVLSFICDTSPPTSSFSWSIAQQSHNNPHFGFCTRHFDTHLLNAGARQARDHTPVSLDLERSLENRDPPGDTQNLRMLSGETMAKVQDVKIGNALLHSHELEMPSCQCR